MKYDQAAQRVALSIIVVFGTLIFLTTLNWCAEPAKKAVESVDAGSCFDYWLNRYQTLFGAIITLAGIVVAYIAVRRQIAAARSGEYRETLRHLNEFKFDVSFTMQSLLDVIELEDFKAAISASGDGERIGSLVKLHHQRWDKGRDQARSTASRSYLLVSTPKLEKSIYRLSRVALAVDKFASDFQNECNSSRFIKDLDKQKKAIIGLVESSATARVQLYKDIADASYELVIDIDAELKTFKSALLSIAPLPSE